MAKLSDQLTELSVKLELISVKAEQKGKQSEELTAQLTESIDRKLSKIKKKIKSNMLLKPCEVESEIQPTQIETETQSASIEQAKAEQPESVKNKSLSILSLKGVGPVTAKKLAAAGISSLQQIAEPTEAITAILSQFEKIPGYKTWQNQAESLLS